MSDGTCSKPLDPAEAQLHNSMKAFALACAIGDNRGAAQCRVDVHDAIDVMLTRVQKNTPADLDKDS